MCMYMCIIKLWERKNFKSYLLVNSKFKLLFATLMSLEGIMISEISQTEKEKYSVTSLKFRIKKKKNWTQIEWNGGYQKLRNGKNKEMLVKESQPSVKRSKSSRNLIYSMMMTINNTVLWTWNLLREQILVILITHTKSNCVRSLMYYQLDYNNHFTMYMYIKSLLYAF